MTRRAPTDGPSDPQNLYGVPDKEWAKFDIAQRIVFNATFADVGAAVNSSGVAECLRRLDSTQRTNVAWLCAWSVAQHFGASRDLRASLLTLAEFERLNPPGKEIG